MRFHRPTVLVALVWALGFIPHAQLAQAQRPNEAPVVPFRFEHLRTADGLSVDFNIRSLLQDREGFLWIGTLFGLNKYDGYTFTHVLPSHFVDAVVEDHQGLFWVGTRDEGLSRLDPTTGAVTRFRHDENDPTGLSSNRLKSLHVDHTGTLWIGTEHDGLDRFNEAAGTFTHFRHDENDPTSLSGDSVRVVYEDREGVLWVGTDDGLSRFDQFTETFTHFRHAPNDAYSLIGDRVYQITEDRQGTLYVGTCRSGLHRFDRAGDRFERLVADAGDPARLHAPKGIGSLQNCSYVRIIHEDAEGGFWVGTYSGGLNYFDPDRRTVTHFVHDPSDPHSLSTNEVYSFFEDRQGTR